MAESNIEWADRVWNPVSGCTRASAGCDHCYAVTMTRRMETMGQQKYAGLTVLNPVGDWQFNGTVRCHEDELAKPLKWKKPSRIFVNSMSDLFHKDVPSEFIDRVFAVMALCPQHTFQVLTKRPERMGIELSGLQFVDRIDSVLEDWQYGGCDWLNKLNVWSEYDGLIPAKHLSNPITMPLPNVWLGVSVEDQVTADERIPHLLKCPAAVRFVSCEPLLGRVELPAASLYRFRSNVSGLLYARAASAGDHIVLIGIDWVIVGGEYGRNARPCDVAWVRSIVRQCKDSAVPCFVKQLGARPTEPAAKARGDYHGDGFMSSGVWPDGTRFRSVMGKRGFIRPTGELNLRDRKGGDMSEWPEDLRVREWPKGGVK